ALRRIAAGFARDEAGVSEEASDAIGRQGTIGEPVLDALFVELHALAVLGKHRVPGAELLDEAAVAGRTDVSNDNVVVRTLLGARAGETDFQCHFVSPKGAARRPCSGVRLS